MDKVTARWEELAEKYCMYIKLERRLSGNTVEAYMRDLKQFGAFIRSAWQVTPEQTEPHMIEAFMASLYDRATEKTTQGRILSGIKSFYNYLLIADVITEAPTEFIECPKPGHSLPQVLSVEEIDAMIAAIDQTTWLGMRNRAILETLYSCGLRVSELISLKISDLIFEEGFVRVTGKGDKQRLVPISDVARQKIETYLSNRTAVQVDNRSADIVFLNRRGKKLTRVMIFHLIRQAAAAAGIEKTISPHTLRHSFATHLLQGGASVRQVQELLGHESILTTEIYTHLDTRHLHRAIDEFHPMG